MKWATLLLGSVCALAACGGEPTYLTREELLDPQACQKCHPDHFTDWSGSMHAYASDDPLFVAMNRRGQRETGGALGTFWLGGNRRAGNHSLLRIEIEDKLPGNRLDDFALMAKGDAVAGSESAG